MKVTSILLATAMTLSSSLVFSGEAEKDNQKMANRPATLPTNLANVSDGTVAGAAILGGAALIGGAAAGLGSGGGSGATGTTGTTSTTGTN